MWLATPTKTLVISATHVQHATANNICDDGLLSMNTGKSYVTSLVYYQFFFTTLDFWRINQGVKTAFASKCVISRVELVMVNNYHELFICLCCFDILVLIL